MPSRSSTAIASVSRSAHTLANSSGKEAPARKLNAERACNSVYINRAFPSETTLAAANRYKSGTAHAHSQDLKHVYFLVRLMKIELPHPIRLDPKGLATTLPKFARARKRPQVRRARRKKISAPEDHQAIPHAPVRWDVKDENHWQPLPFAAQQNSFLPLKMAFFCDRLPPPV